MKKILFIVCVLFSFSASAQVYNLQQGQRESTFYYWGQHWVDHCPRGFLITKPFDALVSTPKLLRFCSTTNPIRVIGIAGCASICNYDEFRDKFPDIRTYNGIFDTINRLPEYFQLYQATSSDPVLLAETRWDTAHPRYQVVFNTYNHGFRIDSMLLYEAFFDTPIEVSDSFFVGGTSNNNYAHYDEALGNYVSLIEHKPTIYFGATMLGENDVRICPMTPHEKVAIKYSLEKYIHLDEEEIQVFFTHLDTNWHIYDIGSYGIDRDLWPWFFPIIDTTGMGLDGFQWVPGYGCDTVRRFRLLYVEGRQAYLSWNANRDALSYEVSYGPEGTTPEQGTKVRTSTSMVHLDSLEPGRRYMAYVRAHCADNAIGVWSDSVTFRIPGSGSTIEDASLTSRFTEVMPNPATTQATVISSFTINRIEVYTAAGQHVLTTEPKANAATLDPSTLSAGTYLLRIQTSAGDTAKKLVVQ